ncbi:alpha-L-fucosidase [Arthrobacter stackebrandtii]|uniref:alpha-L-fucosidase n=1 Tax=Arthrobacter stackebrandtii TaxID=272161 RepID=A0ABS4YU54_9MICC|nr:alpha-L-fucosidase [Arthrobacter stackebrandtii]MBP2412331.1 alpha-L-fucosidase [Arthrobacter stackebrandtii]PYH02108.1 alpha-L-fucosidase [Arthrobacter stackebrandtii]
MHSVLPNPAQLAWQRDALGVFFHFGLNTFHGKEWSDGTLPADSFNPTELDAGQWVRTAASLGAKYVVLTAKHHDGFCLWPTATTDYSVASSPWRGGSGDVVAEVAAACRKHGMKLGLYLSSWDRNAPSYPEPDAYDEFYLAQLRELCSNYGELAELWFDGAGSQGREYAWDRIAALIDELQPGAMVFNMGAPTIRWVGNEDGLAADPVRYVVSETEFSNYTVDSSALTEALYLPPECDVSLRRGWFWHPDDAPKDLDHLLAIYYRSIGLGANLLLNLPPDTRGLIPAEDLARLAEFSGEMRRRFAAPLAASLSAVGEGEWVADFGAPVTFDHLRIEEVLTGGQRISGHKVFTESGDLVVDAGTVGSQRIHVFEPVTAQKLVIRLEGESPQLAAATAFCAGVSTVPEIRYLAPTDTPD